MSKSRKNEEIRIPLSFTSSFEDQMVIDYVHTMSYQDILVFASAQYLRYFSINGLVDLLGASDKRRIRDSLTRLVDVGFVVKDGKDGREQMYKYVFMQYMMFKTEVPPNNVPTIRMPVWVMEIIARCNLHGDDLCMYGQMWYYQYIARKNKTNADAYYTQARASKELNITERTVINIRKKLEKVGLIRKVGTSKAVIGTTQVGHRVNNYFVTDNINDFEQATGLKIVSRRGAMPISHGGKVVQFKAKGA